MGRRRRLPQHALYRHGACELLGLEPTAVACEGRFVAFVHPRDAERALAIMKAQPHTSGCAVIGRVLGPPSSARPPRVVVRSAIGQERVLDLPAGEQLPRIC